jgi:type 1 glutamine amidotransferase
MTGIRFYEVFNDTAKRESAGKAVAVFPHLWRKGSAGQGRLFYSVIGLSRRPNSPVLKTTVSETYLRSKCRRVSESRARRVHPNLFRYLETH